MFRARRKTGVELVLAAVCMGLLSGAVCAREQVVLRKDANGDTQARGGDTWLDASSLLTNNGSSTTLDVQARSGKEHRTLLRFDLSALPARIGVKAATLGVNIISYNHSNRSYEAHNLTSLWTETDASWTNRISATAWVTATGGGDFNATPTDTFTISGSPAVPFTMTWNITGDAQKWYTGSPNFGTLIKQTSTGANDPQGIQFSSREDATVANRPSLMLTFLQNVQNLAATAGDATVSLSWTNAAQLSGSTLLEGYAGVLILRRQDAPVDATSVPVDGTIYSTATCKTIGTAQIVFVSSSNPASFTDDSGDVCGAPANGHVWFYRVFRTDAGNNYSASGTGVNNGGAAAPEISAMPDASAPQQAAWVLSSGAASLAASGLNPGSQVESGSGLSMLCSINPGNGALLYPAVSLNGAVISRATVIDSLSGSLGQNVAYVSAQDNFLYAVNTDNGSIMWQTNPSGFAVGSTFQGGATVQLKQLSSVSFTPAHDIVVAGTRNSTTTTGNKVVAVDGNTGAAVWTLTGGALTNSLDMVNSTPLVDYTNNAIWVTSRSGLLGTQSSLWKLDPSTGAVLFSAALGDIDSSPSETAGAGILFVGTNSGLLYAIDPTTGATLKTFAGGDGAVRGYPAIATLGNPYLVIFATSTKVQAVSFDKTTNTFTNLWSTAISGPSAPLAFFTLSNVYVGGADGKIHELNLSTGVDAKQRVLDPAAGVSVGDVAIDIVLSRVFASSSDGRGYAFTYPF